MRAVLDTVLGIIIGLILGLFAVMSAIGLFYVGNSIG